MTLGSMTFVSPALLALSFCALLYVFAMHVYDHTRRQSLTRRLGDLPVLGRVLASSSRGRRVVKDSLFGLALALVLFAAARPQVAGKRKVTVRGIDVVIALDVSKSMMVNDVGATALMRERGIEPTRLARARELATVLIEESPDHRFAPVVFAGAATHTLLTDDHTFVNQFLQDHGPLDLPVGSNLPAAIRVALCVLRPDSGKSLSCNPGGRRGRGGDPLHGESLDPEDARGEKSDALDLELTEERGKAIVILTDGGEPEPATLVEVGNARELGVAVILVGMGSVTGGEVYELHPATGERTTPKRLADGSAVISKRDDAGMTAVAEAAGDTGRYFPASPQGEVDHKPIIDELRTISAGGASHQVKSQRELYQPFLFAAFMLLIIEAAISTRRRRRYPEAR